MTLDRPNLQILVEYVDGPFSHMQNTWTFAPAQSGQVAGCTIEFFIDYAFKNRLLGLLMGSMFDIAFRRFTAAFEARANAVYGSGAAKA